MTEKYCDLLMAMSDSRASYHQIEDDLSLSEKFLLTELINGRI